MNNHQVVIVGAGPVGLTLANLLGVHGVRTLVLERNAGTVDEPRAIAIDAESLRTMQAIGLYDALAPDMLLGFHVDYLNGRGRRLFTMQLGLTPYGHAQQNSFDQPLLERQLLAGLERFPHVAIRFLHQVERFAQSADGVTVEGHGADGQPFSVAGEYLVGCDGGRSVVRQGLGIEMRGRTAPQKWLVIDTVDPHLADTLACRFYCDPARPAMTLRKQHQKRRWEWMLMPGEADADLLDDGRIRALLAPHTKPDQVVIQRKCVYTFHSIVADRYRDGRVLIAGDAAHMMPPFAGQGMNGGIRDALNLSWKLTLVLRGAAQPSLLDTYQRERRAHVIAATALANRLGAMIQPTSRARAALRDLIFFGLNLTPAGRRAFDRSLIGTLRVPRMREGVLVPSAANGHKTAPLPGQFIVQPPLRRGDGETVPLDTVLGPGFSVLGYGEDPAQALDAAARQFWADLGATFVHVTPRGTPPVDGAVEDTSGALGAWFGDHAERVVALRPDRFCAAQFSAQTAAATSAAFARLLQGAPPEEHS